MNVHTETSLDFMRTGRWSTIAIMAFSEDKNGKRVSYVLPRMEEDIDGDLCGHSILLTWHGPDSDGLVFTGHVWELQC